MTGEGDAGPVRWWPVDGDDLGRVATLVQFSSAFCAPCRATRRVLADVAAMVPGVVHVEVDADERLSLTRAADVRATPTTVVLDAGGREVVRAAGAPRRADVIAAVGTAAAAADARER
ncbi:TlpA family protein disulfide reductase [Streptomyces lonarensis]|uniref:Thioredoxin family protein n=1 Tax=Streptomyces lonarensis TaxID=700599 RepID=A0A7X6D0L5_9ACTN|nr:thioredoxin family protein [Streptomyces lonarensis]NJQ06018.1 thioredoxin family protein [Streptomyces lonarensis]